MGVSVSARPDWISILRGASVNGMIFALVSAAATRESFT
jgi:hypothetical protein